ncbi:MAG TPA: maltose alpha-D-glucosyltransferase [Thermomicrobiales bacterium]|nr:maltose alpha-D-glucosyltransferase [Thermomicrobiales bacterium]
MADQQQDPLWYKDAVFYELHARSFFDSDNNGKGDFAGMAMRLDYVRDLGVDCIWIQPFYPSPLLDDGYDIADFTGIHPDFGTLEDFRRLVEAAHERGLKVLVDFIMNHCSDLHAWFQEARHDRNSPKRDYFVWSDDPTRYGDARIIFIDTQPSNWTFDEVAQQYYWHRFFEHQPDINYDNPAIWDEMFRIARFWLDLGIDGFRCDAIPYLYERENTNCENLAETHEFLRAFRAMIDREYPGKLLLAEANQWPGDVVHYFGTEHQPEFQMGFHFPVMPRLFLSLRREEPSSVIQILRATPEIPADTQWCIFLRNHDELTLEMVTEDEREEMWFEYAPEPRMRCNLGIRRRLAPLVDNDRSQLELLNALLFSLPGSPIVYYGDEIGMGDNIWLRDRNGVRTPMQWSADENAGFSSAHPGVLFAPVIDEGEFSYRTVNVANQDRNPTSLLNWMRKIIAIRKQVKAFGRGSFTILDVDNPHIFAFERKHENERVLCVFNFSQAMQSVAVPLKVTERRQVRDMIGGSTLHDARTRGKYQITLGPRGYAWLCVS